MHPFSGYPMIDTSFRDDFMTNIKQEVYNKMGAIENQFFTALGSKAGLAELNALIASFKKIQLRYEFHEVYSGPVEDAAPSWDYTKHRFVGGEWSAGVGLDGYVNFYYSGIAPQAIAVGSTLTLEVSYRQVAQTAENDGAVIVSGDLSYDEPGSESIAAIDSISTGGNHEVTMTNATTVTITGTALVAVPVGSRVYLKLWISLAAEKSTQIELFDPLLSWT